MYADAGGLTVDNVYNLLDCYKRLVLMYGTQIQGMAIDTTTHAPSTRTEGIPSTRESEDGKVEVDEWHLIWMEKGSEDSSSTECLLSGMGDAGRRLL